ncbi:MAG: hypothetical protein K9L82_06440 [Chromatiaceae bacterium]|nr:hypothetical protein [Chromatiaceae bacterium]
MKNIRCTDCRHFVASVVRCIAHKSAIQQPSRLRKCAEFCGYLSLPETRAALADAGLEHYVLELADAGNGHRALRLMRGVPDAERFRIYHIVGLYVRESERIHLPSKQTSTRPAPSACRAGRAA